MYLSVLVSLFFGVFFSGVLLNKFELILIKVIIPIINYIKRNNNDPYQLKIVYYVAEETAHTQYKFNNNKLVEEDLSEGDDDSQEESEEEQPQTEEEQLQTEEEKQLQPEEKQLQPEEKQLQPEEKQQQPEEKQQQLEEEQAKTEEEKQVVLGEESENNDINNLLNRINSINTKSNVVFIDEKLD